ncbi:hypothetical protein CXF45_08535 [Corynebacterium bovis]|nr:hypothetical protein CXF38_01310 [Corynebacterium bovis]RRO88792.1 hypothetical protein CXF45_08535 [Corynebacterium bovis]
MGKCGRPGRGARGGSPLPDHGPSAGPTGTTKDTTRPPRETGWHPRRNTVALRTNARGSARGSIARSTRALLAFAVTAGVSVHAGTAVADPSGDDAVSVEKYLADLVSQVSSAEKDVAGAEGELGGLRESANKARVDFDRSQAEAQEAQDKVLSARGHLDSSQTDLEKAQAKLNDIARSAYVNGGDAKPVTLASGGDAVADTLDRSSYIRLATEKQKSEVDRLDLARTQAANEESALRGSRDEADSRLRDARQAREAAEQTLRDSAQAVAQKMQDYQRLRAQQDEAKAKLEAARRAVDSQSAAASSFDKRRAAEAAADAADKAAEEKAAADKAAADKAAADKAATDKAAAENAEPQQGADGTTATPGVHIDEKLGPVGAGEKAAVSAATGSTEAAASSTTPSATTTPATTAATTAAATTSASTSTTEIPDSFPDTPEGDALRQAAIDGLRATADAATTAAQGAPGTHAVDAALKAGRQTASQHYRAITAADETGGAATGTATDSDSDSDTTSDGTTSGTTSGTDSTGTTSGTDSTGGTGTSDDSGAGTSGTGTPGTSGTSGTSGDDEDDSDDSTSSTGSGTSSGTSSGSGSTGSGSTGKHSSSTGDTSGTRSERIERVIARGKSQLGVRYSWGGGNYDGPTIGIRDGGVADQYGDYQNVGFDCSGLMMYAFAAAGVKLDHYSGYQYTAGEQIPVAQAERGDMLFWGAGGSEHVALYLGDGKMLEAPQSGSQVRISDVRWGGIQPYAVRVID